MPEAAVVLWFIRFFRVRSGGEERTSGLVLGYAVSRYV